MPAAALGSVSKKMGTDDYDGKLMDEELEDDAPAAPSSSTSVGGFDLSSQPLNADSYHSDPENDAADRKSTSNNTTKDRHGRPIQRRPPRPSQSASSARNPKGASGSSMHRQRTTRRVAAAEKQWRNSSMPVITVRDIMGSEKKATAVGMTASGHSRSVEQESNKMGAEEKRSMIRSRWNEKRSRQSNVKNSLDQFLAGGQSEDSDNGDFDEEAEDEELISDEDDDDDEAPRPTSTSSLKIDIGADSDNNKSVKGQSRDQARRRSSSKRTDGDRTDGDGGGSSHSRSRKPRRRLKKSGGGDDDDRSVGSTKSARSRRAPRRSSRPGGDDGSARRQSDCGGSVGGDQMRRRRDTEEGQKKKTRSMSARRRPAAGSGVPSKSRSTRGKPSADDDDRSVGSRKSVGGRRRRQQSQRTKKSSSKSQENHAPLSPEPEATSKVDSIPVSPLGSKPNSAQSLTESPGNGEHKDKLTSLSQHIEANPKIKLSADLEERSEESSRFSSSYDQPTSIMQFDPTNTNNITMVSQSKANIKSEKFRHADGTESELHISEVAGLPTFEAVQSKLNESRSSDLSDPEVRPQSTNSLGSIDYGSDYDNPRGAKSMGNLGLHHKADIAAQNGRQRSEEAGVNQSGRRGRGVAKTNSAGRRAFLNRRLKPERNEKPPRNPSHEKSTFHESMKGFFGGWNKNGEVEEEEEGNRFFRKREGVEHQALDDDDGSDEN